MAVKMNANSYRLLTRVRADLKELANHAAIAVNDAKRAATEASEAYKNAALAADNATIELIGAGEKWTNCSNWDLQTWEEWIAIYPEKRRQWSAKKWQEWWNERDTQQLKAISDEAIKTADEASKASMAANTAVANATNHAFNIAKVLEAVQALSCQPQEPTPKQSPYQLSLDGSRRNDWLKEAVQEAVQALSCQPKEPTPKQSPYQLSLDGSRRNDWLENVYNIRDLCVTDHGHAGTNSCFYLCVGNAFFEMMGRLPFPSSCAPPSSRVTKEYLEGPLFARRIRTAVADYAEEHLSKEGMRWITENQDAMARIRGNDMAYDTEMHWTAAYLNCVIISQDPYLISDDYAQFNRDSNRFRNAYSIFPPILGRGPEVRKYFEKRSDLETLKGQLEYRDFVARIADLPRPIFVRNDGSLHFVRLGECHCPASLWRY